MAHSGILHSLCLDPLLNVDAPRRADQGLLPKVRKSRACHLHAAPLPFVDSRSQFNQHMYPHVAGANRLLQAGYLSRWSCPATVWRSKSTDVGVCLLVLVIGEDCSDATGSPTLVLPRVAHPLEGLYQQKMLRRNKDTEVFAEAHSAVRWAALQSGEAGKRGVAGTSGSNASVHPGSLTIYTHRLGAPAEKPMGSALTNRQRMTTRASITTEHATTRRPSSDFSARIP